ncbi:MAG: hypothetical protein QNJ46_00505 [Leptolyngbyaceae cyanobacterium MO_188.B28]|nr:hypothetical protein [Leptolyngbyaceae cyanobacterium MO_188.B28]
MLIPPQPLRSRSSRTFSTTQRRRDGSLCLRVAPIWVQFTIQILAVNVGLATTYIGVKFALVNPLGLALSGASLLFTLMTLRQKQWLGSDFDAARRMITLRPAAFLKEQSSIQKRTPFSLKRSSVQAFTFQLRDNEPDYLAIQSASRISFGAVATIKVQSEDDDPYSPTNLWLETHHQPPQWYLLVLEMERWQAVDLARRIGGLVKCDVYVVGATSQPLEPIPARPAYRHPKVLKTPLSVRLMRRIGVGLFVLTIACWGNIAYWTQAPTYQEAPLIDAASITVGPQGYIYVLSNTLNRIQRYKPTGEFERSYLLSNAKGHLKFCSGTHRPIELRSTVSKDEYKLLGEQVKPLSQPSRTCHKNVPQKTVFWQGVHYRLIEFPNRILVQGRDGKSYTLIPGDWVSSFTSLFFCLIYLGLGGFLFVVGEVLKRLSLKR